MRRSSFVAPLRMRALIAVACLVAGGGLIWPTSVSSEPSAAAVRMGSSLGPLTGIDLGNHLHRFGQQGDNRSTILVFLSVDCPISNGYLPRLNRLARRHRRGADLLGVISSSTTRAEAVAHSEKFDIEFPVLFDTSGELRRALRPTHTPQAFVLDAAGRVAYSGAIDDQYSAVGRSKIRATESHLGDAVEQVLAGRAVRAPRTKPVGCLVERRPAGRATTDVTFNRDVAPIIRAHCSGCHRPNQRAPFSLIDYEDVTRHARQIVEVTRTGVMPPWKPTAGHGEFRNQRGLTPRERDVLRTWQSNGMPRGIAADEPDTPDFSDGWQLGRPDLVLRMKQDFVVPADGSDVWQHFVFPSVVMQDRLVAAVEFRPGSPEVVHHASFFIDSGHFGRRLDALEPDYGYRGQGGGPLFRPNGVLRSWFPGAHPQPLPKGMGRPLPKGSDLVVEIHYHPVGRPVRDRSEIGIHFAPRTSRQLVEELQVMNMNLQIPAGAAAHRHRASMTVPVDITLLDTAPHMHLLGKSVRATATRPDGKVVPLIRVDEWDFNWQGHYVYREPVQLPAGSRIDVEYVYDNSAGNDLNPFRPPRPVAWGPGTNDEMGICHFQFTCDRLSDFFKMIRYNEAHVSGQLTRP